MPKPTKHLNYLPKEDAHSSASESTPASPSRTAAASDAKPKSKCAAKRARPSKPKSAQEPKRPKLVTLRASQSDYSDEEDENQTEENEVEEHWPVCSPSKDSSAPAFVPAILGSPQPAIIEVEETMEEVRETVPHQILYKYTSSMNFIFCIFLTVNIFFLHYFSLLHGFTFYNSYPPFWPSPISHLA